MNSLPLFGLSVVMSFVPFGIVTQIYIWPRLRTRSQLDAGCLPPVRILTPSFGSMGVMRG